MDNTAAATSQIVQLFLQHLSGRDLENLLALFSDEVDWDIPGNQTLAPWLGTRKTKADVRDFYELLWQSTEPESASIHNIMVENNDAIISGEFTTLMLQTNKKVSSLFFIALTVKRNLITKYRLLEDSHAVSQSLM